MLASRLRAPDAPFAVLAVLLPPVAVLASNWVVLLLLAAGFGGLVSARMRGEPWPSVPALPAVLLGLLVLWCAIASLWTFDVGRALLLAGRLGTLFLVGTLLCALASRMPFEARRRVTGALAVGFVLGLALMLEERILGSPLLNLLRGELPTEYHEVSRLNRGATALAILCWPVVAAFWHRGAGPRALLIPTALFAGMLFFESLAALLGLGLALLLALLGLWRGSLARYALIAMVVMSFVAGPLIARELYVRGGSEADWLQSTARQRIHVWNFTADRITERPVIGWGFDASRNMPDFGQTPYGSKARNMPTHPHNGALQIVLELGAVGAVLSIALLIAVIAPLGRADPVVSLCAVAMAGCALGIALTAYGIWQSQWISLLLCACIMVPATSPAAPSS